MMIEEEKQYDWTQAFIAYAVEFGYVEPPFRIPARREDELIALWRFGLPPDEAAMAFYATRH